MTFIKKVTLILFALLITFTSIPYSKVSATTETPIQTDCPPSYVGEKKCFFIDNPKLKEKQPVQTTPPKPVKVGSGVAPGSHPAQLIASHIIREAVSNTEYGQQVYDYIYFQQDRADQFAGKVMDQLVESKQQQIINAYEEAISTGKDYITLSRALHGEFHKAVTTVLKTDPYLQDEEIQQILDGYMQANYGLDENRNNFTIKTHEHLRDNYFLYNYNVDLQVIILDAYQINTNTQLITRYYMDVILRHRVSGRYTYVAVSHNGTNHGTYTNGPQWFDTISEAYKHYYSNNAVAWLHWNMKQYPASFIEHYIQPTNYAKSTNSGYIDIYNPPSAYRTDNPVIPGIVEIDGQKYYEVPYIDYNNLPNADYIPYDQPIEHIRTDTLKDLEPELVPPGMQPIKKKVTIIEDGYEIDPITGEKKGNQPIFDPGLLPSPSPNPDPNLTPPGTGTGTGTNPCGCRLDNPRDFSLWQPWLFILPFLDLLIAIGAYVLRLFAFILTIPSTPSIPIGNPGFQWVRNSSFLGFPVYQSIMSILTLTLSLSAYKVIRRLF